MVAPLMNLYPLVMVIWLKGLKPMQVAMEQQKLVTCAIASESSFSGFLHKSNELLMNTLTVVCCWPCILQDIQRIHEWSGWKKHHDNNIV